MRMSRSKSPTLHPPSTLLRLSRFAFCNTAIFFAALTAPLPALAHHEEVTLGWKSLGNAQREVPTTVLPSSMDAHAGKMLFVHKGCIACHAVEEVGGRGSRSISQMGSLNGKSIFEFAAKMWNHAGGMTAAQVQILGKPIVLTGTELGHITAFVATPSEQKELTIADVPASIQKIIHRADKLFYYGNNNAD